MSKRRKDKLIAKREERIEQKQRKLKEQAKARAKRLSTTA